MPMFSLDGKRPVAGHGTWIAPSAYIIGNVTIGSRCWVGPGAVIRGDFGAIVIGDDSAVEDCVVIHTPSSLTVGKAVTIGHSALVHGHSVGDYAVVGMHATLGDNTVVGSWSIVAEHALVKKNQVIPDGRIYGGVPAVEKGEVTGLHREVMLAGKQMYTELAARYLSTLERID
jgi:carbonic anhydrase/acetyltransferase-like protein (isoleucine patch superfamily)